jgi:hypothetical protein
LDSWKSGGGSFADWKRLTMGHSLRKRLAAQFGDLFKEEQPPNQIPRVRLYL